MFCKIIVLSCFDIPIYITNILVQNRVLVVLIMRRDKFCGNTIVMIKGKMDAITVTLKTLRTTLERKYLTGKKLF